MKLIINFLLNLGKGSVIIIKAWTGMTIKKIKNWCSHKYI